MAYTYITEYILYRSVHILMHTTVFWNKFVGKIFSWVEHPRKYNTQNILSNEKLGKDLETN